MKGIAFSPKELRDRCIALQKLSHLANVKRVLPGKNLSVNLIQFLSVKHGFNTQGVGLKVLLCQDLKPGCPNSHIINGKREFAESLG